MNKWGNLLKLITLNHSENIEGKDSSEAEIFNNAKKPSKLLEAYWLIEVDD